MSEYIVISRAELADIINDVYYEGWQNGCVDWDGDSHLVRMRLNDFAKSGSAKRSDSIPTGWRPIAEAPKDGTWVMADFGPTDSLVQWRVGLAAYSNNEWRNVYGSGFKPTHFLPLVTPTEN